MTGIVTIRRMGRKKKPTSGKNKTPRTPVQMPTNWLEVARARAAIAKQPTLWYLISLIEKDAKEAGVTGLPLVPWERRDSEADRE